MTKMRADIRRHILTLTLGGALAVVASPALHAQATSATPAQPPTTNGAGPVKDLHSAIAGDQQKAAGLDQQLKEDKGQLNSDIQKYGKNSPQVKADRSALKSLRNQQQALNRNIAATRSRASMMQARRGRMPHAAPMAGRMGGRH